MVFLFLFMGVIIEDCWTYHGFRAHRRHAAIRRREGVVSELRSRLAVLEKELTWWREWWRQQPRVGELPTGTGSSPVPLDIVSFSEVSAPEVSALGYSVVVVPDADSALAHGCEVAMDVAPDIPPPVALKIELVEEVVAEAASEVPLECQMQRRIDELETRLQAQYLPEARLQPRTEEPESSLHEKYALEEGKQEACGKAELMAETSAAQAAAEEAAAEAAARAVADGMTAVQEAAFDVRPYHFDESPWDISHMVSNLGSTWCSTEVLEVQCAFTEPAGSVQVQVPVEGVAEDDGAAAAAETGKCVSAAAGSTMGVENPEGRGRRPAASFEPVPSLFGVVPLEVDAGGRLFGFGTSLSAAVAADEQTAVAKAFAVAAAADRTAEEQTAAKVATAQQAAATAAKAAAEAAAVVQVAMKEAAAPSPTARHKVVEQAPATNAENGHVQFYLGDPPPITPPSTTPPQEAFGMPLSPAGWEQALDPTSACPYYFHRATGETRWTPPAAGPAGMPLLPAGWEQALDPTSACPYYFNRASGETSWTPPAAGPAGMPAATGLHARLVAFLADRAQALDRSDPLMAERALQWLAFLCGSPGHSLAGQVQHGERFVRPYAVPPCFHIGCEERVDRRRAGADAGA